MTIEYNTQSQGISKIYKPQKSQNFVAPAGNLGEYEITNIVDNTLTLDGATFTTDYYKDKVICIKLNGICQYAIIKNNTSNTITVDDDLIETNVIGKMVEIYNTKVANVIDLDSIIAVDNRLGDLAIIAPKVSPAIERMYGHVYVEFSNGTAYKTVVIAREEDRIFGAKWAELIGRTEGARLYAHNFLKPHWDVLTTYNIKRYATAYFNTDELITDTTFTAIGNSIITDNSRRFAAYEQSGVQIFEYTSLFPLLFFVRLNTIIEKTGSAGECSISIAHYKKSDNTTTIITDRTAITRFGGGEGISDLSFSTPITLSFGDKIWVVAKKTAGTFVIVEGSNIEIFER